LKRRQQKIISAKFYSHKMSNSYKFNWFKKKIHTNTWKICWATECNAAEISIFSNRHHHEWRAELSDTILKRNHPSQIWFNLVQRFQKRRFKCDFSLKYAYLHNRYKSTERNISQKQLEHMLNYSLSFTSN
jgi:hypothetical protein